MEVFPLELSPSRLLSLGYFLKKKKKKKKQLKKIISYAGI